MSEAKQTAEKVKAVVLDLDRLMQRARSLRADYRHEANETDRLNIIARCFLVQITAEVCRQIGEDEHDELVRAMGFDHLARDLQVFARKPVVSTKAEKAAVTA